METIMAETYPGPSLAGLRQVMREAGAVTPVDAVLRTALLDAEASICAATGVPCGVSLYTHCHGEDGKLARRAVLGLAVWRLLNPQAELMGLPWPEAVRSICEELAG